MSEVFISYSRKNKKFVQKLNDTLDAIGRNAWVDWEGIPVTAEWWKEIQKGIEEANTFIFVISQHSVESKVCRDEVEYAVTLNKRLVPIIRNDGFEKSKLHPALSKYNWLFFRDQDNYDEALLSLIKALDTDLNYVQTHTHILQRALEWEKKGKSKDNLLRGRDFEDAQEWLRISLQQNKVPAFTNVMLDYMKANKSNDEYLKKVEQYNSLKNKTLNEYVHSYLEERKKGVDKSILDEEERIRNSDFFSNSVTRQNLKEEQAVLVNLLGQEGRWHPKEAERTGMVTDARNDYVDIWRFPCCDKHVGTDNTPSQFRDDGCEDAPKEPEKSQLAE